MRQATITGWAMAAAIALAVAQVMAQQEEGPILLPKPQPRQVASPTLLVICDLACNWKLDGVTKGRIDAGGSTRVKVGLGQHVVLAATEDGADQVKQHSEVKSNGQTIVSIELQPIRDARLKAEQQARDKAQQEARDKAEREADKAEREAKNREKAEIEARDNAARQQQKKQQEERDQDARDEAAGLVWIDPVSGLMWQKTDNGSNVNWGEAADYCRSLKLAEHSDWRLPTIAELYGIYDPNAKAHCSFITSCHIMGSINQSAPHVWSSSRGHETGKFRMNFETGVSLSVGESRKLESRALCVRDRVSHP